VSKDVYTRLREFMDTLPAGFPATPTNVEIKGSGSGPAFCLPILLSLSNNARLHQPPAELLLITEFFSQAKGKTLVTMILWMHNFSIEIESIQSREKHSENQHPLLPFLNAGKPYAKNED
jgi:hypothetical protein